MSVFETLLAASGSRYALLMDRLMGFPIAVVLCCGLPLLAACTRTSDGSVVVARPVPGFLRPALAAQPVAPPAHPVATQFPPEPTPPVSGRRARPSGVSVPVLAAGVKPPFERTDPQRPLSCRNESTPSGRIRMVCR